MKNHASKFKPAQMGPKKGNPPPNFKPGPGSGPMESNSLVNKGEVGRGSKMVTDEVVKQAEEIWKNYLEPITGCKDYESMRMSINKELNHNFQ